MIREQFSKTTTPQHNYLTKVIPPAEKKVCKTSHAAVAENTKVILAVPSG